MTVEWLSPSAMKKRVPEEGKRKVDASLEAGLGVALYRDGNNDWLVNYGRGGDIPTSNPPSSLSSARLIAYCVPQLPPPDMVSPLLKNREEILQIRRPPSSPPRTVYPDIR
jgi:hypothetical protein